MVLGVRRCFYVKAQKRVNTFLQFLREFSYVTPGMTEDKMPTEHIKYTKGYPRITRVRREYGMASKPTPATITIH